MLLIHIYALMMTLTGLLHRLDGHGANEEVGDAEHFSCRCPSKASE